MLNKLTNDHIILYMLYYLMFLCKFASLHVFDGSTMNFRWLDC